MDDEGAVPKVKHRSQPARQATFISVVAALVVSSFLFGIHLGTTYSVPLLGATKTSIKTHPVLFEEKREFWGFNDEANEAWNNFLPDNGGFLLQKSKNGSIEEVGVSMFHQLHCLRMIREGIRALMLNKSALDAQGHFPHHIQHCFDYLRQGIVCAADSTREPLQLIDGHQKTNGFGHIHECGDSRRLWLGTQALLTDDT